MRQHAARKDRGFPPVLKYDANWDSDMVYGCHCDTNYFGGDCSRRTIECVAASSTLMLLC